MPKHRIFVSQQLVKIEWSFLGANQGSEPTSIEDSSDKLHTKHHRLKNRKFKEWVEQRGQKNY